MNKKCCVHPFTRLQIEINGDCYFCCPSFCKDYCIGNIFEQSFEEIWYGEKAVEFRKSILDGSYKYCDLSTCGDKWYEDADKIERGIKLNYETCNLLNPTYPENVNLSYSRSCNVRCVTCRDEYIVETKRETDLFDKKISNVLDACKYAYRVYLNGGGEVFTSPHFMNLIKMLCEKNPNISFMIHSNGILCNEKNLKDLNIINRLNCIVISIHAATKKTYDKIVKRGNWDELLKNLDFLSKLDTNFTLKFIFVFHSLNYKEMPKFVDFAKKYGAEVHFWRFRKWGEASEMNKNYNKYTCWEENHPDYKKFLKVLKKLDKKTGYVFDEDYFKDLQEKQKNKTFLNSIFKFFGVKK